MQRERLERGVGAAPGRERRAAPQQRPDVSAVLALQRSAGNHAVARALARTEATEAPSAEGSGWFGPTEGEKQDTGGTPGSIWRWLSWAGIGAADLAAEVVQACGFEDFELSADFLRHYMSGRGAPFELELPADWQAKIASVKKKPGKYRDVSAYEWKIPDMKNSLGHFDLEVESIAGGGKLYTVTDHYYFPAFVDGKAVHHGFEVDFFGKLPAAVQQSTNDALALLGDWKHPDGTVERFEIKMLGGHWTFVLPQVWLADSGVDFDVHGSFLVQGSGAPAAKAEDDSWF